MRVGRLILVVATIVTVMVFPLVMHEALAALKLPSAYAAPNIFDNGGRVYQNGNFNDDDDDDDGDNDNNNDESDNEGEDNDNDVECYLNLNDNDPVPCDFEDNDNDPVYAPPAEEAAGDGAPSGDRSGGVSHCFGPGETGAVFLDEPDYDVRVTVVNPLGAETYLGLRALDQASVPAMPDGTTLLDTAVWQIDARVGCNGGLTETLPAAVNLAIEYSIPADKSGLQILHLENNQWVEVDTVPDPTKPYISSTIDHAGTYAVVQD